MNALILKYKPAIQELCKSLNVKQLYLFGSGVDDSLKKNSDLDFILTFKEHLSAEEYADNFFLLHQKLQELLNREIDLITERSLSNPYFIQSVNKTKELIYDEEHQKVSL